MRRPGPNNVPRHPPAGRPNTVGLHGRDLATLLDEFDIADPIGDPQRDFVRWPFRYTSLRLQLIHPGGNATAIRVACRNLSRGGMSLLHSAYLHPGSRCTVHLPHPAHGEAAIDGWVVRCTHRSGMVHEIGVAFTRHIDVHAYVPALRNDSFTLERVDPAALAGALLYVDDCDNSFQIFRHHLAGTSLRIAVRASGQQPPPGPFDLVIVGHPVRDADQAQFLSTIRRREPGAAVIVLTSQHPESARRSLAALNPDAVLVRPVQQQTLLRALGEFLIVRRRITDAGGEASKDAADQHSSQNIAHIMQHCARRLEEALNRQDAAACRALCVQIAGAAPMLGLRGVGRLAAQTADDLTRTMSIPQSHKSVRAVIAACQRVQASAA